MSMTAHEAEVARLQAEIDRLGLMVTDFNERIVCGRLTGELPDNFLEQFNQLPDRPLEQVLRFLPARQVAQMRHVSRKFNHIIRKCSSTMPKKGSKGEVVFKVQHQGVLTVDWFDDRGKKVMRTTMTLTDDEVALSELLRFIRIDGRMFFSSGVSAADEVLDQLSKAWLTIRPEMVIFSGDLSQTSRDSLRAFLVKVEPSIRRLNFQNVTNISDSLLSDDVIAAAGLLNGLMVVPVKGSKLRDINIGDETLLSMVDADHMSSYLSVIGASGITPGGIRSFVEKWMKKEKLKPDGKTFGLGRGLEMCELAFDSCANVTAAAVEEACGDLLKEETLKITAALMDGSCGVRNYERVGYTVHCHSGRRILHIFLRIDPFLPQIFKEPRSDDVIDDEIDDNYDDDDLEPEIEDDDFDDYDEYDAIDYDDDEDSDLT
uniref:F-box domain-containing protein n=1 Tax=Plectus sambesii TaxID=2011161 RepID=A0A914XK27_9BILA